MSHRPGQFDDRLGTMATTYTTHYTVEESGIHHTKTIEHKTSTACKQLYSTGVDLETTKERYQINNTTTATNLKSPINTASVDTSDYIFSSPTDTPTCRPNGLEASVNDTVDVEIRTSSTRRVTTLTQAIRHHVRNTLLLLSEHNTNHTPSAANHPTLHDKYNFPSSTKHSTHDNEPNNCTTNRTDKTCTMHSHPSKLPRNQQRPDHNAAITPPCSAPM